jgi:hypothetical protein
MAGDRPLDAGEPALFVHVLLPDLLGGKHQLAGTAAAPVERSAEPKGSWGPASPMTALGRMRLVS